MIHVHFIDLGDGCYLYAMSSDGRSVIQVFKKVSLQRLNCRNRIAICRMYRSPVAEDALTPARYKSTEQNGINLFIF